MISTNSNTAAVNRIPVIDTHIHFFDTRRPGGVPWPPKSDRILYRPALPARYRKLVKGLSVVGAIEIECSPLLEDNQWVLDVAAKDKLIAGTVGDLEPEAPEFPKNLERFQRNPLFRGIRCGNLWGRNLSKQLSSPRFVSGLKLLADADLEMDTANPDPELISGVVRVTDKVPRLRVVIDHLPQLEPPSDARTRRQLQANLHELGKRPQVYAKLSEVVHRVGGRVRSDLALYRPRLDELCEIFGEDRVIYGSDWPNSDKSAPFRTELKVVRDYFAGKGTVAAEKFFWKNSFAAYRWIKRAPDQPQGTASRA
ncbi:MAG: amidohydrolase family protein [Terriglobia bacterium]